ncbi:MAG: T9SS type A sorting domain-containing protein [Clostridium sp.]|nr:T9SS type A sorting domain-containing protein [Clostridium sp.]
MKRQIMALALMGCSACHTVVAQSRDYLTIQTTQTERSIALANLKKITFSGSQLIADTGAGELAFDLVDMKKLYFADTPSAISGVKAAGAAAVSYDRMAECIRVEGNEGRLQVTVYSINGAQWVNTNVEPGGGEVNVSTWPKGIYIVKTNGGTLKFSKQ